MLLTAEQAIGYRLLQLPNRTQALLKCPGILEFGNLLELIDTYNDVAAFLLRYLFRELQNLVNVIAFRV